MLNSEALPQSNKQRFINRLANAAVGEVLTDPDGRMVEKTSYAHVRVNGGVMLIEDYLPVIGGSNA